MKSNYLLLFTSTTLILSTNLIAGKSILASEDIFHCQLNKEMPTTIIKTSNNQKRSIFNWNLDPATTSASPKQLCNSVTQKLNNYLIEGNDLSSLTFKASIAFDDKDSTTLPAVCISSEEEPCKLSLFTLKPSDNPQLSASNALDSILASDLQATPVKSPSRGFQSTAYKVNFWQLLGF